MFLLYQYQSVTVYQLDPDEGFACFAPFDQDAT
jgi:hypothetical protein